jgi:hypothetical protein
MAKCRAGRQQGRQRANWDEYRLVVLVSPVGALFPFFGLREILANSST